MEKMLDVFAALNDPTRLTILRFLQEWGPSCVCELEASLDMIQSRLSRHLKILRQAGFLQVERRGSWSFYALNPQMPALQLRILEHLPQADIIVLPKVTVDQLREGAVCGKR